MRNEKKNVTSRCGISSSHSKKAQTKCGKGQAAPQMPCHRQDAARSDQNKTASRPSDLFENAIRINFPRKATRSTHCPTLCVVVNPSLGCTTRTQEKDDMEIANNPILETLLNETDVARLTGLSVASVRRWRLVQKGPRYVKIGAAVRYKPEDLSAWLASRPTGGEQL
jgi:predicted DNA-binding transcriptional regulator AlpA